MTMAFESDGALRSEPPSSMTSDDDRLKGKESLLEVLPEIMNLNERVFINVGGTLHETYLATLNRLPDTRLSKLAQDFEKDPAYDEDTGYFFFNRNPIIFLSILQYYRTGELHVDHSICGNAIKNELDFWQIDANDIEPCCWAQYAKFLQNKETLKMLDDSFAIYEDAFIEPEGEGKWKRLQRRLWRHVEDPTYSVVGKLSAILSIFFIVLSILAYVLETHPFFRRLRPEFNSTNCTNGTMVVADMDHHHECNNNTLGIDQIEMTEENSYVVWWLNYITFLCFGWFFIEFIFRVSCCPYLKEFFKSTLNIFDMVVLIAMCLDSLSIILSDLIPHDEALKVLVVLRFARIIRVMKLVKHYRAFKVLVYTIKVSLKELALMIIFLMIGVVIFACLAHYAEPENFRNIPIGCWWALVTMTTVGFGDYHPKKFIGYVIGAVAAIFGVLMIAFTVPIVVNNFSLYYSHAQTRAKMRPKRRATKLLNKLAALTMFVPTLAEIQESVQGDESSTSGEESKQKRIRKPSQRGSRSHNDTRARRRASLISSSSSLSLASSEERRLVEEVQRRQRRASRTMLPQMKMVPIEATNQALEPTKEDENDTNANDNLSNLPQLQTNRKHLPHVPEVSDLTAPSAAWRRRASSVDRTAMTRRLSSVRPPTVFQRQSSATNSNSSNNSHQNNSSNVKVGYHDTTTINERDDDGLP